VERSVIDTVVSDLEQSEPALVIVDVGRRKLGFRGLEFDLLEYFGREARFREAFARYELAGKIGDLEVYRRNTGRSKPTL
jgi:hypothetical protein